MRLVFISLFIFTSLLNTTFANGILKGRVTNKTNGEGIEGCGVLVSPAQKTYFTDKSGYFSISLPEGNYSIAFRHIAFEKTTLKIYVKNNKTDTLNVQIKPVTFESSGVTITAAKEYPEIVMQQLKAKDMDKMPNIYSDVLRSVQILAGVSSNNELSSSYNVRGGSTDENLIYLNGYEIYRPMLLREGVEENQSLINPDMVGALRFSNGAFSALYGDKMSSALDVEYAKDTADKYTATARADLMDAGVTVGKGWDNASVVIGARYAYPKLFLGGLQTKGDYNPSFKDLQIFSTYKPTDKHYFEVLYIYNDNKYNVLPKDWVGGFNSDRGEGPYGGSNIQLIYNGYKNYSLNTNLLGFKYKYFINSNLSLNTSYSYYKSKEVQDGNVSSDVYFYINAQDWSYSKDTIKTRVEKTNEKLELKSNLVKIAANWEPENHSIEFGSEIKFIKLDAFSDDFYMEYGKMPTIEEPQIKQNSQNIKLDSKLVYANDIIKLSPFFSIEAGARLLFYDYTNEKLFSPRGGIYYYPNSQNTISFNCGVYYQPPFFNEFNGENMDYSKLVSQKATHYVLGWQYDAKNKVSFHAQLYYKDLKKLLPFYYDDMKIIYRDGNVNEGYAYGADFMVKGEVVKGIDSWLGYSYLNSKERKAGTNDEYKRRLYDQTHTFQIFLQDRIPRHPEFQSHLRFLAGSGFLFYDKQIKTDPVTGQNVMSVNFDKPVEFIFYERVDMGLSYSHKYENGINMVLMAEILNVFDKRNVSGYDMMMVFPDYKGVLYVPQFLSSRFFNIKASISI